MEEQQEQALIRHNALCTASDKNYDLLAHRSTTRINICDNHFPSFMHNLKPIYEYEHIVQAALGNHCLLIQ